jgi:hypothetical protein
MSNKTYSARLFKPIELKSRPDYCGPKSMAQLEALLQMRRGHQKVNETIARDMVSRWVKRSADKMYLRADNLIVEVGESRTLFSSHLDTVHRGDGWNLIVFGVQDQMYRTDARNGDVLGADDAAGVWVMVQMIQHRVPGVYVFHIGEEFGGVGSEAMRIEGFDILERCDHAVAFDRKGTSSIITHQGMGTRCASSLFAKTLAQEMGRIDPLMIMEPDDTGVFTDTANYTDIIPECTNISVGYYREHTTEESLDINYLQRLAEVCTRVNWAGLPVGRDPRFVEPVFNSGWEDWRPKPKHDSRFSIEDLVQFYPQLAVDILVELGYTDEEANDAINEADGVSDDALFNHN